MKLSIYQVDAFTREAFHGNPAAVVPLDEWLPAETMLAIAAENNLAETAFFVRKGDRFELTWFTPEIEIDLCGHATLASAYVIWNELGFDGDKIVFDTEAEVLALRPDFRAISALGVHAVIVTAPGDISDFVSRFFAPSVGVDEDPVTGSAHCTLIPYWAEQLGKTELYARQVSKRGGELFCMLEGDRVKIAGNAVLYLKGEIYVEASGEKSLAA
jgi:predicted PhzF superfamily epimerase YddE/YHI9